MENYEDIRKIIFTETTQDITDVRLSFLNKFGSDVEKFIDNMSQAFLKWRYLDLDINDDEKKAHVSALVYSSINLHIFFYEACFVGVWCCSR